MDSSREKKTSSKLHQSGGEQKSNWQNDRYFSVVVILRKKCMSTLFFSPCNKWVGNVGNHDWKNVTRECLPLSLSSSSTWLMNAGLCVLRSLSDHGGEKSLRCLKRFICSGQPCCCCASWGSYDCYELGSRVYRELRIKSAENILWVPFTTYSSRPLQRQRLNFNLVLNLVKKQD